jgi:hypothetical protein
MSDFQNYYGYIQEQAELFVSEYLQEAVSEIKDGNTDMQEFISDSRSHEWVDNDFIYVDLIDSAHILDQSNNVETDSGLWEGQDPEEAIKTMAFFTYRADLEEEVRSQLSEKLGEKFEEVEEQLEELELQQDEDADDDEQFEEELEDLRELLSNLEEAMESL